MLKKSQSTRSRATRPRMLATELARLQETSQNPEETGRRLLRLKAVMLSKLHLVMELVRQMLLVKPRRKRSQDRERRESQRPTLPKAEKLRLLEASQPASTE